MILVQKLINWVERNWLGIIIVTILSVFIDWKIGYYSNAIYGTKFELGSCWAGLAVIASGGFISGIKYLIDSALNSEKNKPINQPPAMADGAVPQQSNMINKIGGILK